MSVSRPAAVVVLAAGEGTRMKSATPKVLHMICGRPLLDHVLTAAREVGPAELIVVVGHGRDQVTSYLSEHAPEVRVVVQDRQGGTGHAVRSVIESVGLGQGTVVVTYGDTPLLRGQTLVSLVAAHEGDQVAATALTAVMADPTGLGRIIRDGDGRFAEVVEEADATPEQRAITEVNSGIYAFEAALLADAVKRVGTANAKGEEYLTDVLGILRADGYRVATVVVPDVMESQGVNDRVQLARARTAMNTRLLEGWMRAGVTVTDPQSTSIDAGVVLAPDVVIAPATQLEGTTVVEPGASVGPGCLLRDTTVGRGATVTHAVCEEAVIGPRAVVGPFVHLAPGTHVPPGTVLRPGGQPHPGSPPGLAHPPDSGP
ncbi:MAG TPA: NTP transferase domain-containing protein [Streptosporangiaceae bacterium]|nr:NTP transferase domain-containing protein [Streptosporangiaceae bacterium]